MSLVAKRVETRGRIVVVDDRGGRVAPPSFQSHAHIGCCLEVADVAGVATLLRYDPQRRAVACVADDGARGLPALTPDGLDQQMTPGQAEPGHRFGRRVEQVALYQLCASARAGVVRHPSVAPG